jgi:hypothetical protein
MSSWKALWLCPILHLTIWHKAAFWTEFQELAIKCFVDPGVLSCR